MILIMAVLLVTEIVGMLLITRVIFLFYFFEVCKVIFFLETPVKRALGHNAVVLQHLFCKWCSYCVKLKAIYNPVRFKAAFLVAAFVFLHFGQSSLLLLINLWINFTGIDIDAFWLIVYFIDVDFVLARFIALYILKLYDNNFSKGKWILNLEHIWYYYGRWFQLNEVIVVSELLYKLFNVIRYHVLQSLEE